MSSTTGGAIWLEKDKDAKLNYEFKLGDVVPPDDRIANVTWRVAPVNEVFVESVTYEGSNIKAVIGGGVPLKWYAIVFTWTTLSGLSDTFIARVHVQEDLETEPELGSALFPNRFTATSQLRRDRLLAAAAIIPNADFSDDYLWGKLRAAESEVARTLRVPLVPTQYFPEDPSQSDIDALAGMPWEIDPGYDLGPESMAGDRWGIVKVRHPPLISIQRYRFAYPAVDGLHYDVPLSWLRPDRKYGLINVVPASFSISVPLSTIVMQALAGGRTVPLMLQVTYQAGLVDVHRNYPELVDVVKKLAILKCIEDRFVPQSGSVSADGLSQSMSVDMDKYRDTIDHTLNGAKGANGGLMAAIHGVRSMVF